MRLSQEEKEIGGGIEHLQTGRRFAEKFVATLCSWAKSGTTIAATMHVGIGSRLTVFRFTLGQPISFVQTLDDALVDNLLRRAIEVVPTCDPTKGDLAVFDGKHILMFRRFDEKLTGRLAVRGAKEVASYILMNRKR